MNKKWPWILLTVILLLAGSVHPARADGIIIPEPCPLDVCPPMPCFEGPCPPFPPRPIEQLEIRYHHVTVTIEDQIAVTRVDQVFHNPNDWAVEGVYVFPLPLDAVVSNFSLWIDGEPVQGEVMDAKEARAYYEEIVRSLRDPALLEYQDRGAVRASVFPIQPGDDRRIELEYTQALTAENGLVRYVYPLNTEKFSLQPLEEVRVSVEIRDGQDIRAVYSPSHPVDLIREDARHVKAAYEATNVRPDSDFALYYSVGKSEAFHLFSYRDPADATDPDGFFMLLLAPSPGEGLDQQVIAKDVLLVLDRSGSMEGQKFRQAQQALRYILQRLNPEDRFYLQAFSTGVEPYASGLRPAGEASEALAWVDRLAAAGSTDIHRALLEAAAVTDPERPTYLIFLTDGLPTEGVVDREQILADFARSAPENLRTFVFGVGYDVDTFLLDTLSQEHHGLSTYVRENDALDEVLSAFYERISIPVLTNLSLDFGGLAVFDIYPDPLPDLFSGSQVIVVGRYREGGVVNVTLRGEVNGAVQEFRYAEQRFSNDSRGGAGSLDALPRLWATRKIGYLLNRVRLDGPDKELIEQIVRLSVRYGIVTPYTSYLVTEPMPLGATAQEQIANDAFGKAQSAPLEPSGQGAVERAASEGAMQSAEVAPQAPQAVGGGLSGSEEQSGAAIRTVGPRMFVLQDQTWVDTLYDPEAMSVQQVIFLSDDYFGLSRSRADVAAALALGDQVIVVIDGKAYSIVLEGEPGTTVQMPEVLPTATPPSVSILPTEAPFIQPTPQAVAQNPEQPDSQPEQPRQNPCPAGFLPVAAGVGITVLLRWRKHA